MIKQQELFEIIFSDAHLVDIDLSAWDRRIVLYVLADHVGRIAGNRLPMFAVEFGRVHNWNMAFNHLDHAPPIDLGPDEHVQWRIHNYRVEDAADELEISLWSPSASPSMVIVCEDVLIWELDYEGLYQLFPRWSQPGSGFVRPGLDVMLGYGYSDRLQASEYADYRLKGFKKYRR